MNHKSPSHILKEFDKPLWIAAHFGFTPTEAPKVSDKDREMTADCEELPDPGTGRLICDASEKAAFIRAYIDRNLAALPHPLALAWKKPAPNQAKTGACNYSLELVDFPPGIAEAKLIRTSLSILADIGYKRLVVEINSMGDKDSIAAYERELREQSKKLPADLAPEVKKSIKDNAFHLFKVAHTAVEEMRANLPSSIAYLSSASRNQFKEVLEYLEALGVEFRLSNNVLANKHFCSETMFVIRNADDEMLLAAGYRYSRLSKRFGFKKELPLMGATIYAHAHRSEKKRVYKEMPRSRFYLVQLGRDAKMRSLSLIERLREEHLPVHHVLGRDKLIPQMERAEALRVDYLLILGQKEAIDNTVTIRNVSSRAQDTIPMTRLSDYLKHITLVVCITIASYTIVC